MHDQRLMNISFMKLKAFFFLYAGEKDTNKYRLISRVLLALKGEPVRQFLLILLKIHALIHFKLT